METLKVCALAQHDFARMLGRRPVELHATVTGEACYYFPDLGKVIAVGRLVRVEDRAAVNAWQADPDHDSLRARGDPRWQAACSFTQRPVVHR